MAYFVFIAVRFFKISCSAMHDHHKMINVTIGFPEITMQVNSLSWQPQNGTA